MSNAMAILICTVAALGIWNTFVTNYRRYRLLRFRQELFELRAKLFRSARNGVLGFDHPAYHLTRTTLNGMLRFAHEASVLDFFLQKVFYRPNDAETQLMLEEYQSRRDKALRDLNDEQADLIAIVMYDMNWAMSSYVLNTSILLAPIVQPAKLTAFFIRALGGNFIKLYKTISKTKTLAYSYALVDAVANYYGSQPRKMIERASNKAMGTAAC